MAAGGISDGHGVAAVLTLGASAACMGTALLRARESGASAVHKAALAAGARMGPGAPPTCVTTAFSGRPGRAIVNSLVRCVQAAGAGSTVPVVLPFPAQHALTSPLRAASAVQGTPEYAALWAGQGYCLSEEAGAQDLLEKWARQAASALT